jgi:arginyl-tRNA--protein-N-Asp/Glu arginylyltransferase
MKSVIFTKSQENLFLQHSKPLISYNPNERIAGASSSLKESIKESTLTEDNYHIYKNYVKATKKQATNKTYKRLLKNMDENLREIFENVKN